MLSLAPALAEPPKVLIADEPTLGLAPLVAEVVLEALSDLRAAGTAILLAEEKASEVMKLADVVTVVELGRIAWTRAARGRHRRGARGRLPQRGLSKPRTAATRPRSLLPTATKHTLRRGEEPAPRRSTRSMHKHFTRGMSSGPIIHLQRKCPTSWGGNDLQSQ